MRASLTRLSASAAGRWLDRRTNRSSAARASAMCCEGPSPLSPACNRMPARVPGRTPSFSDCCCRAAWSVSSRRTVMAFVTGATVRGETMRNDAKRYANRDIGCLCVMQGASCHRFMTALSGQDAPCIRGGRASRDRTHPSRVRAVGYPSVTSSAILNPERACQTARHRHTDVPGGQVSRLQNRRGQGAQQA